MLVEPKAQLGLINQRILQGINKSKLVGCRDKSRVCYDKAHDVVLTDSYCKIDS